MFDPPSSHLQTPGSSNREHPRPLDHSLQLMTAGVGCAILWLVNELLSVCRQGQSPPRHDRNTIITPAATWGQQSAGATPVL